jgi:chaperone BCS1
LRPGRIDRKFQYNLATKQQAAALFRRFYPEKHTNLLSEMGYTTADAAKYSEKIPSAPLISNEKESILNKLSEQFASYVPEHEFSTAELQGFLLTSKQEPEKAVAGVAAWVEEVREEREARMRRVEERRLKKMRGTETKGHSKEDGAVPVAYPPPGRVVGGGGFVGGGTDNTAMVVPLPPPNIVGAVSPLVGLGLAGTSSPGANITFSKMGEPTTSQEAPGAHSSIITTNLDLVNPFPMATTPPAPDSPALDGLRSPPVIVG